MHLPIYLSISHPSMPSISPYFHTILIYLAKILVAFILYRTIFYGLARRGYGTEGEIYDALILRLERIGRRVGEGLHWWFIGRRRRRTLGEQMRLEEWVERYGRR
ncbi:hypothetical protein VTL71DRAFT_11144 [Oculimacula yallundae]|uniref:Uncharacterized protein n=1 Tax=Oculimacula yallundae TaxID=86028 RepID=A0ABR4CV55_9HELO